MSAPHPLRPWVHLEGLPLWFMHCLKINSRDRSQECSSTLRVVEVEQGSVRRSASAQPRVARLHDIIFLVQSAYGYPAVPRPVSYSWSALYEAQDVSIYAKCAEQRPV